MHELVVNFGPTSTEPPKVELLFLLLLVMFVPRLTCEGQHMKGIL